MSYQEKRTIVSVVTGALLLAAYCIYAFGKAGMANLDNLKFWATTILVFIGIGIVALIIIQIVFHILLCISMAVKQKMKDETCDDKEIEKSIEREMVEDEMDKLIDLKATSLSYGLFMAGVLAGLACLAFGMPAQALVIALGAAMIVAGLAGDLAQLAMYRRGI